MKTLTFGTLLFLALAPSLFAFDNSRKGFVLGMGFGPAHVSSELYRESETGILTDLVVGAGINDQTMIYYGGKHFWFRDDQTLHSMGYPAIVVRYYMSPRSPSFYMSGGLGGAVGFIRGSNYADIRGGLGLQLSAGYEFTKNVDVRVSAIRTRFFSYEKSTWTISGTVNVLGY